MTTIKRYSVTEPYLRLKCSLGEGPFYETDTGVLRFTDIEKHQLHWVDLHEGPSSHSIPLDLPWSIGVTAAIEGESEHFAFAGKHGYGIFNRKARTHSYIQSQLWNATERKAGHERRLRMNDGAIDPRGRFWAGAMTDQNYDLPPQREGVLFRLDADLSLHRMLEDVGIPNGMSWTSDEKHMYFTESMDQSIYLFDIEMDSGSISNRRVFYHTGDAEIVPDGHAVDTEDHLWVALHGGGKVIRLSPNGEIVAEVQLPTRFPTCPVFADDALFVTTAAETEPEKHPASAEFAGSIFKCNVGVKGRRLSEFKYKV